MIRLMAGAGWSWAEGANELHRSSLPSLPYCDDTAGTGRAKLKKISTHLLTVLTSCVITQLEQEEQEKR